MAKAKSLNGKDLMLWIKGKVVALSTSCDIDLTANTVDSSTKDDGTWDASEIGSMGWSVTNESVDSVEKNRSKDYEYDQLFDFFVAGEPVDVTVGLPTNTSNEGVPDDGWTAPTKGMFQGQAVITNLKRTGSKGSNGTVSISLTGYGALKRVAAE